MEFRPDACTRTPYQQAYGFAAVAKRQHKQSRSAILAALRVTNHRTTAVIDLGLFSDGGEDDPHGLWRLRSAQLANKALHGLVAVGKAMIGDQVLPDGHGIPATTESLLDQCAVRLADTGGPILLGSWRWGRLGQSGGAPQCGCCWGRGSPHWPFLLVPAAPTRAGTPLPRLTLGKRWLFLYGHQ